MFNKNKFLIHFMKSFFARVFIFWCVAGRSSDDVTQPLQCILGSTQHGGALAEVLKQ